MIRKFNSKSNVNSTLELRNPRTTSSSMMIMGQLTVNSIRNKSEAVCNVFKENINNLMVFGININDTFLEVQFCVKADSNLN